jgi:hypothetical protein
MKRASKTLWTLKTNMYINKVTNKIVGVRNVYRDGVFLYSLVSTEEYPAWTRPPLHGTAFYKMDIDKVTAAHPYYEFVGAI